MSLTSKIQALIAYANETTGKEDTTLGECIKTLCEGYVRKGLPTGYKECAYLESTGTQWIMMPFLIEQVAMSYYTVDNGNLVAIFGSEAGGTNDRLALRYQSGYFGYHGNVSGFVRIIPMTSDGMYDVEYIKGTKTILVNGQSYAFQYTNSTYVQCLFAMRYNGDSVSPIKAKVFSFKGTGPGGSVELIPALDPSGRPCMFNMVSGLPIYNGGTGEFLYELK